MEQNLVKEQAAALYESVEGNVLRETDKIRKQYVGTRMFDAPIVGFGSAEDELFATYKDPSVIGPWHMSPEEWLPGAKSIVSLFFPMSEAVLESNRAQKKNASKLWVYARFEGQDFINAYSAALCDWFRAQGFEACAPAIDPRFQRVTAGKGIEGYPEMTAKTFGSRWSERHAAYVCGLGTFALSKGMITERGIAGRFASVIVTTPLEADARPYSGIYDYCIRCGACVKRCPVHAISLEHGKSHIKCGLYQKVQGVIHHPRYGCGLCQTKVPCEHRIPLIPNKQK